MDDGIAPPEPDGLGEFGVEGERPILIPPGLYPMIFSGWHTMRMFKRPKLVLRFRVLVDGDFTGTRLCRYYNVQRLIDEPKERGRFKVSWQCSFMREYAGLFGMPERPDRIPMSRFSEAVIEGRVSTVEQAANSKPIPEGLRYSTISELVRVSNDYAATA